MVLHDTASHLPELKFALLLSQAITDFCDDLREHNASDNVPMFLFTEFGRRARDNGSGTDHGSAGAAFAIGDAVKGGIYNEHPSHRAEDLLEGDLHFTPLPQYRTDLPVRSASAQARWTSLSLRYYYALIMASEGLQPLIDRLLPVERAATNRVKLTDPLG